MSAPPGWSFKYFSTSKTSPLTTICRGRARGGGARGARQGKTLGRVRASVQGRWVGAEGRRRHAGRVRGRQSGVLATHIALVLLLVLRSDVRERKDLGHGGGRYKICGGRHEAAYRGRDKEECGRQEATGGATNFQVAASSSSSSCRRDSRFSGFPLRLRSTYFHLFPRKRHQTPASHGDDQRFSLATPRRLPDYPRPRVSSCHTAAV